MVEEPTNEMDRADQPIYDVVIIGGGPAGSTAATYAARAELTTLVLDKGLTAGAMGKAGKLANWPGEPEAISGLELLRRMREQAQGFGAEYIEDRVVYVELDETPKQVFGGSGVYQGRTVIIATGAMGRSRTVPGEERLVGRGVSYCATCDAPFFKEQQVAVVGNNDEALDEALYLTRFASQVHLLAQTAELEATPALTREVLDHEKVEIYYRHRLREVLGEEKVRGIRVSTPDGEKEMAVAGVFIFLQGMKPITDFLGNQLSTSENGCLLVDDIMQTNTPGVFAVGDVLCTHLRQAVIASADGAVAAMAAQRYLADREALRPDWSTVQRR